jgi:transcriptional regulator with XRE-family HTH domain
MQKNISISPEDFKRFSALLTRSLFRQIVDAFEFRVQNDGLTRKELADRLGVDKSVLSRRLNGTCNYTLETLSDMARAMDFKPEVKLVAYETLCKGNDDPNHYSPTTVAYIRTPVSTVSTSRVAVPPVVSGKGLEHA